MAVWPAHDREAFDAHWRRILADDSCIQRTIVDGDEVAGNIGSWPQDGRRYVGYWIGREFWGSGLATQALQEPTGRGGRTAVARVGGEQQRQLDPGPREVRLRPG